MIYAGIGSRQTPTDTLKLMILIGQKMAESGHVLRSGAADGADEAFEEGCNLAKGPKEIYLPWKQFRNHESKLLPNSKAIAEACKYCFNYNRMMRPTKLLFARNQQQILGENLDSPTNFMVCWTPGGNLEGGTRIAIQSAIRNKVPYMNLGHFKTVEEQKIAFFDFYYKMEKMNR